MTSLTVRASQLTALAGAAILAAGAAFADGSDAPVPLEFPVETKALVAATAALFDSVQAETAKKPAPRPVIRLPKLAKRISALTSTGSDPLKRRGPLRHLTGYRINWYPTDRFLGSVDFMGTWDGNRNLVCGYLMWDLSDPEAPVLDRVSASYVDLDDLRGKAPAAVHEALLEANCAYGAIEANFAFFEVTG